MATIGAFIGALVATYLFSRLLFWFVKGWDGGSRKVILVHAMSLIVCGLLGGMGFAADGAFAGAYAISVYAVPQFAWMVVDLLRLRKSNQSGVLTIRGI
jgi:hypothetical protein